MLTYNLFSGFWRSELSMEALASGPLWFDMLAFFLISDLFNHRCAKPCAFYPKLSSKMFLQLLKTSGRDVGQSYLYLEHHAFPTQWTSFLNKHLCQNLNHKELNRLEHYTERGELGFMNSIQKRWTGLRIMKAVQKSVWQKQNCICRNVDQNHVSCYMLNMPCIYKSNCIKIFNNKTAGV